MMTDKEKVDWRVIGDYVEERIGLHYSEKQLPILASKISAAAEDLGYNSCLEACKDLLKGSERFAKYLVSALTNGQTYFFRNQAHFDFLSNKRLFELASLSKEDRRLTIWSAGCATGEEPYSLAIWIHEHAPELWSENLEIVATDINPVFLERARKGCYEETSLRMMNPDWRDKYFVAQGLRYQIDRSIKRVITFKEHNMRSGGLPAGLVPGKVSLVLCRNVFIYFSQENAQKTLELFRTALNPEGILMLGHAESFPALRQWRTSFFPGTFYYRPFKVGVPSASEPVVKQIEKKVNHVESNLAEQFCQTMVSNNSDSFKKSRIELPKKSLDDFLAEAKNAINEGRLEAAQDTLGKINATEKTCMEGQFLEALVHEQLGDWDSSRSCLKKALFLDNKLVIAHYFLGIVNERVERLEEALRCYRTVCRLLSSVSKEDVLPLAGWLTAGYVHQLAQARIVELAKH
jgi:chemotaxis protein methyltransferase CheR